MSEQFAAFVDDSASDPALLRVLAAAGLGKTISGKHEGHPANDYGQCAIRHGHPNASVLEHVCVHVIIWAWPWAGITSTKHHALAHVSGRTDNADDIAFLRDAWDFRNVLLVEQPNGDFGKTLMRQFLFDAWHLEMLKGLMTSSEQRIAEIAAKAVKEVQYHVERSGETVIGLGDGSEESHARMQAALDHLWPYVGEMFAADEVDAEMLVQGIAPDLSLLRANFDAHVGRVMGDATLTIPDSTFGHKGGKSGFQHTEHLGHILTQMQWLQRAYPGANW